MNNQEVPTVANAKKPNKIKEFCFGKEHSVWLKRFHIIDWVTILVIIAAAGICTLTVTPYNRFLPQEDSSTGYPTKKDIVPEYALFITTLAGPLVIFALTQIWKKSRHDFHHACLGVYAAWAITFAVTTAIKLSTGSYRPNYVEGSLNNDLKQSFPSGHSSLSFSSMVFLTLYLAGKFKVFNVHGGSLVLKGVFILCPVFLAMFIAISRTMDYHHSFADILAGSLIGSGIGTFCYFLFYPLSFADGCDKPRKHGCNHDHQPVSQGKDKSFGSNDGVDHNQPKYIVDKEVTATTTPGSILPS